jgi:hypothetical protein
MAETACWDDAKNIWFDDIQYAYQSTYYLFYSDSSFHNFLTPTHPNGISIGFEE